MRSKLAYALLAFATLTASTGCGESPADDVMLPGFNVPPPPTNGMQIVLPIVRGLAPGSNNEICVWSDVVFDHDVDVRSIQGFQSEAGHHVALSVTKKKQPAGTSRPCTDEDMATFRYIAATGGEGGDTNNAPGDLVYRIPAGTQLTFQQHFINASLKPTDVQSAVNITVAEPGHKYIPSRGLAFLNTDMRVPPGRQTMDINCTMPRDINAWYFIPHMHRHGVSTYLERTTGTGTPERLLDIQTWDPSFEFHAPEKRFDISAPLVFKKDDKIHLHCEWNNNEARVLTFGLEMCVAFAQTIDREGIGNIACDNGDWTEF